MKYLLLLIPVLLAGCVTIEPGICFYKNEPWEARYKIKDAGNRRIVAEVIKESKYRIKDENPKLGELIIFNWSSVRDSYVEINCPNSPTDPEIKEY